ncbi:hypothetical protein RFI_19308, partial [Reticulomyxa filosa]
IRGSGWKEEDKKQCRRQKTHSKIASPPDVGDAPYILSGLDLVVYLDVIQGADSSANPEQLLLERAHSLFVDPQTNVIYHVQTNPPPVDEPIKSGLEPVIDEKYIDALPEHLHMFNERKQSIIEWYQRFGNWHEFNVDQEREILNEQIVALIKSKINEKITVQQDSKVQSEQDKVDGLQSDGEAAKENQE